MRLSTPVVGFGLLVSLFAVGCGGGGSVGIGGGSPSNAPKPLTNATAKIQVNVATRQVTIFPLSGNTNNKIFQGNTIGFASTLLLDQPGDTGRKALSVSLVNHSGEAIGVDPNGNTSGLNVIFGAFTNISSIPDLRPQTQVSTFAGTGGIGAADGSVLSATFNSPNSICVGLDGSVYLTDTGNDKIRKISGGVVSTFAGNGTPGETDGLGTSATFTVPVGIALNPTDGSLIVADLSANKIRRITVAGRVYTIAGTGATGNANGTGNVATFRHPSRVAVDQYGHIYVTEDGDIRKLFLNGNPNISANYTVSTFAGSGTPGFNDGIGTAAQFNQPAGIAVDPSGNVYVADYGNNRIRFIGAGAEVVTIAGNGTATDVDGTGDVATLSGPLGLAYYNGALFVTEQTGNLVRELIRNPGAPSANASSWNVVKLAGTGIAGSTNGTGDVATFDGPNGIAIDKSGGILEVSPNDVLVRSVIPSSGTFPLGTPAGSPPSEPVRLGNPSGFTAGTPNPFITYSGSLAAGASSTAQNWVFVIPSGVTAFEFTVSVQADTQILALVNAAMNVGSALNQVTTFAGGSGESAIADGVGSAARFFEPRYEAIDAAGNLYVADDDMIRRVDPTGRVVTIVNLADAPGTVDGLGSVATLFAVDGIAVTADGKTIYVTDQNDVRRIALVGGDPTVPDNWSVSHVAGSSTPGNANGAGNVAQFNLTGQIAISSGNALFLTEQNGNRVRRIRFMGGDPTVSNNYLVDTFAGDPAGSAGSTNAFGTSARFSNPHGLCFDGAGNIYVSEIGNQDIRKITPGGLVTTLAGNNPPNAAGYNDGSANSAQFNGAYSIVADSAGYLYVAETNNNDVRRISPDGFTETVAGHTSFGFADGTGATAQFNQPIGIVVGPSGTLLVADFFGRDIRKIERVLDTGSVSGKR